MATGLISTAAQPVSLASTIPTVQTATAVKPVATPQIQTAPNPVAAPTTNIQTATAPKNNIGQTGPQSPPPQAPTATARTVGTDETVAGQLNTLLNQNSNYMQSARNSALEQANQRGLVNSSIAVGSGQRAAIDAALPIAQQDATTHASAAQSAQEANQNYGLSGYNAQLNSEQARQNYGYNSQLAAQNAQATADLQTKLKQMDINLDTSKLSSQERQNFSTSVSPIIQQVESEIASIQRTPDEQMDAAAKTKAINDLNASLQSRLKTLGSIYGYQLSWNTPAVQGPAAAQPGLIATGSPGAATTASGNAAYSPMSDPNYISA